MRLQYLHRQLWGWDHQGQSCLCGARQLQVKLLAEKQGNSRYACSTCMGSLGQGRRAKATRAALSCTPCNAPP